MSKRARDEAPDTWEEAKEPWFFWGLEQQRWIDAFVAHMRKHPIDHKGAFEFRLVVWPDVTIPKTIAPSWDITAHWAVDNMWGVTYKVAMATELWDQLRSGFCVFSREVLARVVEALPEYQYVKPTLSSRHDDSTKLDYGHCIVELKRAAPAAAEGEKKQSEN